MVSEMLPKTHGMEILTTTSSKLRMTAVIAEGCAWLILTAEGHACGLSQLSA